MLDSSIASQYQQGNYAYPNHMGEPSKMDKNFYLAYCKAFLYDYVNNNLALPYNFSNGMRSYGELRAYARGTNSPDKYKQLLIGKSEKGDKVRNNWMNISMDAPKIIPKFRDVIKGIAMSIDFDVSVFATDPSSQAQRDKEKAYYKLQNSATFNQVKAAAKQLGVNVPDPKLKFQDNEQVDLFFEAGGFKLGVEIAAMACIIQSKNLSDIDTTKEQVIEDLIDLGIGVMRDEINANGQIKVRYVDPANFFCSYSQYNDHRNMDKCAEFKLYKIRELREQTDLDEKEIKEIAQKYAKNYSNDAIFPYSRFVNNEINQRDSFHRRAGAWPIDDYRVAVMNVCFIAGELETYTKVKNKKTGATVTNKVANDYELSPRDTKDGKELIKYKTEYVYECKWIPGTNVIFDYGKAKYIIRKTQLGENEVRLPYHVYKTGTSSIVERCVPYADDIAIATFKIRNTISKLPPAPRMAIDKSVMQNIELGGVKFTPLEVMDLFQQAGTLFYQSLDDFGDQRTGTTSNPISFMPSGIGEDIQIFRSEIEQGIHMMRQVTGINELIDGSTPPERTAVGVANLATGAANNTLKPLFKGYEVLYQRVCTNWLLRWQVLVQSQGYKGKVVAIGENNAKVIELTKDFALADIGLFVKPAITSVEKEELLMQITQLRNANVSQGGVGGISPDTYLMLRQVVMSGNMPLAQKLLAEAIKQQKKEDEERQMRQMQANAQVQQQSAQVAGQEERTTEQLKHANKMRELAMEAYVKSELIQQENDVTRAVQTISELFPSVNQQQN